MSSVKIVKENRDISPYVVEVCRNSIDSYMPEQCFKTKIEAEKYIKVNLSHMNDVGYFERNKRES